MENFSEKQINAIIGSLLGDGSLTSLATQKTNSSFVKTQKKASKQYLLSLFELLVPYSSGLHERLQKNGYGKGKINVNFYTKRDKQLTALRKKWYQPHKIVPPDLVLNPEILAWWFCDDGTNSWKHRRATIYSQSFSEEENYFLVEKLKEIGIASYVGKTYDESGSGFCIDFAGDGYFDLLDTIRSFVKEWDCMSYKVDTHGAKKGLRRGNKTGVNGVYWSEDRKRWCGCIKVNGKSIGLGRFEIFEDAVDARKKAEKLYGFSGCGKAKHGP